MKPEVIRESGYDPREASTPAEITLYAGRMLGCEIPVGRQRTAWYGQVKREMAAQGWTWDDLTKAIRYCKAKRIRIMKVYGILYYVHKAKTWVEREDTYDLHAKVSDAIRVESDPVWLRKLTLAQGKALEEVYQQWCIGRESGTTLGRRDQ